jgi:hypothetical protein
MSHYIPSTIKNILFLILYWYGRLFKEVMQYGPFTFYVSIHFWRDCKSNSLLTFIPFSPLLIQQASELLHANDTTLIASEILTLKPERKMSDISQLLGPILQFLKSMMLWVWGALTQRMSSGRGRSIHILKFTLTILWGKVKVIFHRRVNREVCIKSGACLMLDSYLPPLFSPFVCMCMYVWLCVCN